ncbi:protein of unknown function [Caballeronia sp. S22]
MGGVLRAALQLPRSPLFRYRRQGHGGQVEGDDVTVRQNPHSDQRRRLGNRGTDSGISGRVSRRRHPAHRARCGRHLQHRRRPARREDRPARHHRHILRTGRSPRARPLRNGRGVEEAQDSDRRHQGRNPATDLHGEPDRADLLRDHPAQGQSGLRRRQLQGAVRVDRTGSDAPRRAEGHHRGLIAFRNAGIKKGTWTAKVHVPLFILAARLVDTDRDERVSPPSRRRCFPIRGAFQHPP